MPFPWCLGIDLHGVRCLEGGGAGHALEDQDPQHPPVHRVGVASRSDHLRREVVGCATGGIGLTDHELGQAHVGHLTEFTESRLDQLELLSKQP